jgi:hypothetical protein
MKEFKAGLSPVSMTKISGDRGAHPIRRIILAAFPGFSPGPLQEADMNEQEEPFLAQPRSTSLNFFFISWKQNIYPQPPGSYPPFLSWPHRNADALF